ncbi:hypothetical protein A4A49_12587 [Nicotiana attenuata]|uniref:Uncharacterized protein n=1 Tax=Nicotiana attenuata TaxID=49451 RepID=A0A1J6HX23_NICAT|nr:hypothetical protein A4A49_12587 [Nicotiana attenuata]
MLSSLIKNKINLHEVPINPRTPTPTPTYQIKKFSNYGRYRSILSLLGNDGSVIVILELALNAGWKDIALKIERFIMFSTQLSNAEPSRTFKEDCHFAKAVRESNWQTNTLREAAITANKGDIIVMEPAGMEDTSLLKRCITGNMAEQIRQKEWRWKNIKMTLDWWNHFVGCISNSHYMETTWIRDLGIPLHLWSQKIFSEVENLCDGWISTEEETCLKNHLKWARIQIAGDGRCFPSEVVIKRDGTKFFIPIWVERKTRFEIRSSEPKEIAEESRGPKMSKDRWTKTTYVKEMGQLNPVVSRDIVKEHMGFSSEEPTVTILQNKGDARAKEMRVSEDLNTSLVHSIGPKASDSVNTTYGTDFAARVIFDDLYKKPNKEEILNPFFIDLKVASESKQQRYTIDHSDSLTLESEKEEMKNTATSEPGKQPIETDGE